jgi:hypothetical protein
MVEILQKCLQQYSGVSVLRARKNTDEGDDDTSASEASKLFDKLLQIDTGSWDDEIRDGVASSDDVTTQKLTNEIQKTMVRVRKLLSIRRPTSLQIDFLSCCQKYSDYFVFVSYIVHSNIIDLFKENVVLGLENGSMAQRVQAEYLRELVTRVEAMETKA